MVFAWTGENIVSTTGVLQGTIQPASRQKGVPHPLPRQVDLGWTFRRQEASRIGKSAERISNRARDSPASLHHLAHVLSLLQPLQLVASTYRAPLTTPSHRPEA